MTSPSTSPVEKAIRAAERGAAELKYLRSMFKAGLLTPNPLDLAATSKDFKNYGNLGAGPAISARRVPQRTAIVDELGSMTFEQLNDQINSLANALIKLGVKPHTGVAILARNHRGFVLANFACARIGARAILLNTDFAGPQIREVADREGAKLLIYDEEYANFLDGFEPELGRYRCWADTPGDDTVSALVASSPSTPPGPPEQESSIVILTSGTTGTPKGAPRAQPKSLAPAGGVLTSIPFRANQVTSVPAPMFHGVGFLHSTIALSTGCTLILRRKFNARAALEDLHTHKATALVCVPVMLSRMVDEVEKNPSEFDLKALRIIFVSGSQLGSELATRGMNAFGPILYNLYGSTEVAFATIAGPDDMKIDPSTVGRVCTGAKVRLFDEAGKEVPEGDIGRIFVGTPIPFEGYTGGGHKENIDGLLATGDVGYFSKDGLLFVTGRDDEMIVSGGENVFPAEIENLLNGHPSIKEATAMGVDDEKWGARLHAYVALHPGETLTEDDVRNYVKENLARYKVPRDVTFVDELPRNPSGKILKRVLREGSTA